MTAAEQLNRIVQLVAELSQREREGRPPATLSHLAERFATTVTQIESDIRTLTLLCDDAEADWLLSIRVLQEGETVWLSSGGPFRRPIRFTAEEMLALSVGLATEENGAELAARLASVASDGVALERAPPLGELVRDAVTGHRCIEILYTGERTRQGSRRVIHPHQVAVFSGHVFVMAWCERATGWRHFRLDRILDAVQTGRTFQRRGDFRPIESPEDLLRGSDDGTDDVRVRFSREIARWMLERYADAQPQPGGEATVTYRVADIDWLVRRILQYGPEAEVLEPEEYREAMRQAVAG